MDLNDKKTVFLFETTRVVGVKTWFRSPVVTLGETMVVSVETSPSKRLHGHQR